MVVRSQTYYPEHILAYGSEKAHYALVVGSSSFWIDGLEVGKGGGLSTTLRPGLKCGGLESKFERGPGPCDRRVMGWSCLYLGCVFLGYIDSRIAGRSGMACLRSSTVVRTRR